MRCRVQTVADRIALQTQTMEMELQAKYRAEGEKVRANRVKIMVHDE